MIRALAACLLAASLLPQALPAQSGEKVDPATGKKAGPPRVRGPLQLKLGPALAVDLSGEKADAAPKAFTPALGAWRIVAHEGRNALMADGRPWKQAQGTGSLASTARSVPGAKQEAFIESVKAFAYYPYALAAGLPDFREGELSVRFKVLAGDLDQCAGIVFNIKPSGDYLALRFNGKEDNLVLWTFFEGKRSFVVRAPEDVALPLNTWHTLKVVVKGNRLEGWIDDRRLLDYALPYTVNGKVGVWTKTDSVALFEDFTMRPAVE